MIIAPSLLKHREVERELRKAIEDGAWKPGEQLPGSQVLAQQFGVAYMTVLQAVASLVDEGVLRRVRGKGTFVVEREMPEPKPTTRYPMALLFRSDWTRRDSFYFPEILEGFQRMLESLGHQAAVHDHTIIESAGRLDTPTAIALLTVDPSHIDLANRLRDAGHPVLVINRYNGRRSIPSFQVDDAGGVEKAIAHLVSLGHERIGFLRGIPDNLDAADRLHGFRAAALRHDVRAVEFGGDFTEASGYESAMDLLKKGDPPTAIVCASDLSAIGALGAARELGISCPRDLSIVGFGDFSIAAYMNPGLTTVRQSRLELGRLAAEALVHLANDEPVSSAILNADLIIRESTGPRAPSNPAQSTSSPVRSSAAAPPRR